MTWAQEYLLSVTAAGIICAVAKHLLDEKCTNGKLLQVILGIFMIITLLSPVLSVRLQDISFYFQDYIDSAHQITQQGEAYSKKEMGERISEQTQSYILKEADSMGLDIEAKVTVSDQMPPTPEYIEIRGNASAYKREQLYKIISENFHITREHIVWM